MNNNNICRNSRKFFLSSVFALIACSSLNAIGVEKSSIIFEGKSGVINGKEHLYEKPNVQQTNAKQRHKTKSIKVESTENNTAKKEPSIIVFSDFPFLPSSSSYIQYNKESIVPVSQQKINRQAVFKTYQGNTYFGIEKSNLSLYLPEQRQKFSIVAIQCGILTSASPNSPPV